MRCNPLRWLWGLIPIAMLSWIAFNWERPSIEADLTRRTQEELGKAGLGWAKIKFSGRDGVLTGLAAEEGEPKLAQEKAAGVWGVRAINSRTDLIKKVDNYSWHAIVAPGRLALSGFVPNEQARSSVLEAARAAFPKLAIDDAMELARGAPEREIWLTGIGFGLTQLANLNNGTLGLDHTALSIAGDAIDTAAYKRVNSALNGKLPAGISLKANDVTPPLARVFSWNAAYASNQLTLAGHVPSEKLREDLFNLAKKKFSSVAIVDQMETAAGAPDGWAKAASVALEQLALLEEGMVSTKSAQLVVAGSAKDEGTADGIRKNLRSQVPATFRTTEKIEFQVVQVPPTDYDALWREAEARWTDMEAKRPRPAEPTDDGVPWWKEAQARLAEAAPSQEAHGQLQLDLKIGWGTGDGEAQPYAAGNDREQAWQNYEARWAMIASEYERSRAENEAREQDWREREARWAEMATAYKLQKEAEEARRTAWLDAEERWLAINLEYQTRRAAEEKQREKVVKAEVKAEADRCQTLMGDAVKKGRILFKTGMADLDTTSTPTLNKLASIAKACPRARVEISGHTDSEGELDMNMSLSERRAQAIVSFLTNAGVDSSRLNAKGYGPTRPVAPNTTAQNKAKNRRIEFSVVPN